MGKRGKNNRSRNEGNKSEPVDLLEIGPDDGNQLLEFEGSSGQKARIKVIGVGGGAETRSIP